MEKKLHQQKVGRFFSDSSDFQRDSGGGFQ